MKSGVWLSAGFGETIGATSLQFIKDMGFRGVRQDIPWAAPAEYREKLFRELAHAGMGAILIVAGNLEYANGGKIRKLPENWRPTAIEIANYAREVAIQAAGYLGKKWYLEIGNEPNLENHGGPLAKDPKRFAFWLNTVPRYVWEALPDAEIISGGICGLHKRSLKYLGKVFDAFPGKLDERLIIGFHPYRFGESFDESKSDIEDAFGKLKKLIGLRRFAVTEIGEHTAPQKVGKICPREFRLKDDDIAEFAKKELALWQSKGAELLCWFQLNDGEHEFNPEHSFGIRDLDGRRKPVADAISAYIKGARV